MLWNIVMHALIGWLGPTFFTLTIEGVVLTIVIVCCTQGVDLLRIKRERLQSIDALPEKERETAAREFNANIKSILARTFIQNVVLYGFVVLIAADLSRSSNWM